MFGTGFARRRARSYRRRGLDRQAAMMVDFLAAEGLAGSTVLEVGGGVGEIGVELVRRGASTATTLELSTSYDEEARRLAREAGVADRVHRQVTDVAASPADVESADLVVLHRVVCCYPDFTRLLGAAADHCRARLAFSHPPRNLASRGVLGIQNGLFRLTGRQFRAFAHPPAAMLDVVIGRGFRPVLAQPGPIWQVKGLAR
jgi:2-polyprenyl-3-methyl-5-hydroxy-6-metoxy-1,4-benzoquinol methylase